MSRSLYTKEKKKNEFENERLGILAKCDLLFDHVFFLYFVCLLSNAMSFCHDQYSENMIKKTKRLKNSLARNFSSSNIMIAIGINFIGVKY